MPELTTTTTTTIVLVHGALTDASVWRDVIVDLQERGHHVLAPALAMRSLAADAAYLRSVLDTLDGPIVVAGHSYGGSIISHPDALPENVRGLAFVAAFLQDHDESAGELNHRFPGSLLTPETTETREYPGGTDLYLQPERFAAVYAADVERATIDVMAAAQHPIDPAALAETFSGTPTWARLPSWALVATADVSIPTDAQRFMARRAGSTVVEVSSSHAVPLSHPRETGDLIAAAVATTTARTLQV